MLQSQVPFKLSDIFRCGPPFYHSWSERTAEILWRKRRRLVNSTKKSTKNWRSDRYGHWKMGNMLVKQSRFRVFSQILRQVVKSQKNRVFSPKIWSFERATSWSKLINRCKFETYPDWLHFRRRSSTTQKLRKKTIAVALIWWFCFLIFLVI